MKVLNIVGARPQFIKAALLSEAMKDYQIEEKLVHSGQHYDDNMSQIFWQDLGLPKPAYHLQLGGLSHGKMTGKLIEEFETIFLKEKPQVILVYGDTNTTLAASIAASKLPFPLAHIEAGLRSYNKAMPEEVNRVLCDHCSDCLFVPSVAAKDKLLKEGVDEGKILNVGDIMYDVYLDRQDKAISFKAKTPYLLATCHRQEALKDFQKLEAIFSAFENLHKSMPVYLPLHPATQKALKQAGLYERFKSSIHFLPPQGYLSMLGMMQGASLILTDSGGLQKEAYFSHIPSVILRKESEWEELVEKGYAVLAGTNTEAIVSSAKQLLQTPPLFNKGLYGKGNTARLIADKLWTKYHLKTTISML